VIFGIEVLQEVAMGAEKRAKFRDPFPEWITQMGESENG